MSSPYPFSQRQVSGVAPGRAHTLILDDYDGDGLTDLGTYDTGLAWAAVSRSSGGWSSSLSHFRFPNEYNAYFMPNPAPYGTLLDVRAGGIAVVGARHEIIGSPPLYAPKTVGTLTLWDPATGKACTVRDSSSIGDSTGPFACDTSGSSVGTITQAGGVGDIPLGGLKATGTVNSIAGLAFIHFDAGGAPSLERRMRTTSGTTTLPSVSLLEVNPRGGAAFVADMGQDGSTAPADTPDGLPEFLIQGRTPGTWYVYWSNTGYTTRTTVITGSMMSRML